MRVKQTVLCNLTGRARLGTGKQPPKDGRPNVSGPFTRAGFPWDFDKEKVGGRQTRAFAPRNPGLLLAPGSKQSRRSSHSVA